MDTCLAPLQAPTPAAGSSGARYEDTPVLRLWALADRPGAPSCGFTQEAEGLLFNIPDQMEELKHPRACLPCEKACLPATPNGLLEALKMPRVMLACRRLEVTGSPWQLFLLVALFINFRSKLSQAWPRPCVEPRARARSTSGLQWAVLLASPSHSLHFKCTKSHLGTPSVSPNAKTSK